MNKLLRNKLTWAAAIGFIVGALFSSLLSLVKILLPVIVVVLLIVVGYLIFSSPRNKAKAEQLIGKVGKTRTPRV